MMNESVSDYTLERYVLGELDEEDGAKVDLEASRNPAIRQALRDIDDSNRDILTRYPPDAVKAELLKRLEDAENTLRPRQRPSRFSSSTRLFALVGAAAAALVLILFILPGLDNPGGLPAGSREDLAIVKGDTHIDLTETQLLIYRQNRASVEVLADGALARTGDLLQLAYVAADDPFGMILSIDGRGTVTLHLPLAGHRAEALHLNKKALLPLAIELDDAPEFERFFLITAAAPFSIEDILEKAKALTRNPGRVKHGELDLPESMKQYSILILKGEES